MGTFYLHVHGKNYHHRDKIGHTIDHDCEIIPLIQYISTQIVNRTKDRQIWRDLIVHAQDRQRNINLYFPVCRFANDAAHAQTAVQI
ncbi:hypothetical protein OPKNFCMD_4023 [Methylobacterium crusticola]|uniref:Uncharacterized protein n=1 Tax=Methylobacterium crusticola TaxID=1697972 RepID=A0ABQ4R0R6_9HYPH|nr:hypothetical protein [Methylobacterium crusticola]GJD51270.1 hypothetical protein OPKNFCMD_4023 [Methylobacterium crusticola]